VTKILGFDAEGKYLFVETTGKDPKGLQTYKINMTNFRPIQITKDGGTHRTQLSHSGKYLIDNYSALDTPRKIGIIEVASKDCKVILTAENPLKAYRLGTTEFVKLKANNGMELEARILKPADFDAKKNIL
jgi:dipeptidyl-peptidase-4